jgi:hypothetical protein
MLRQFVRAHVRSSHPSGRHTGICLANSFEELLSRDYCLAVNTSKISIPTDQRRAKGDALLTRELDCRVEIARLFGDRFATQGGQELVARAF